MRFINDFIALIKFIVSDTAKWCDNKEYYYTPYKANTLGEHRADEKETDRY